MGGRRIQERSLFPFLTNTMEPKRCSGSQRCYVGSLIKRCPGSQRVLCVYKNLIFNFRPLYLKLLLKLSSGISSFSARSIKERLLM